MHELRLNIYAQGLNLNSWAKAHGFSPWLVYQVARGTRKCLRGQSLQVAMALGMKPVMNN